MIGAKGKQIFNFTTYYNTVCILKLLINTMKIWNSFSGLYPWRTSPEYYQIVFKKTTDTLDSLSLVNPSDDHVMIPGKLPVCLWFQVKKVFAVLGYGQKSSRDSEMSDNCVSFAYYHSSILKVVIKEHQCHKVWAYKYQINYTDTKDTLCTVSTDTEHQRTWYLFWYFLRTGVGKKII